MHHVQSFLAALVFFTRVPCGRWYRYDKAHEANACVFLPAVGWLVGALGGSAYLLAASILPPAVAVVLAMMSTALATGAMHEDGLADSCDAMGAGGDRARMLAIMSDPRCGAFGVVGLGLVLLLKFATLAELMPAAASRASALTLWVAAHASSRLTAVCFMAAFDHAARGDGHKTRDVSKRIDGPGLLVAAVIGLTPLAVLVTLDQALIALAVLGCFAAAAVAGAVFVPRLGGYTGDCLGAVQQLAEVAFFVAALALISPPA